MNDTAPEQTIEPALETTIEEPIEEPIEEQPIEPTAKITKYTADEWREPYKDIPRERIRLCKTFSLDKETGQLKKGNPGKISSGTYATFNVSLRQLRDGIANLTEQQAIGLGTAEQAKGRIGSKYWKGEIKRTKPNFRYRNQPTIFLIDVDGINLPQGEILEIISGIVPGFAEAGKLIVHSSSAGLSADGKLLKDSSSMHIYVIIEDGTDASRFMDALFDRLWLAGHGFYLLSKTPSLLSRSIIDKAVVGAERLVYEAKPRLLDGITQNRPDPVLIEGGMLDTNFTLDLSDEENETLEIIRQEKKAEIRPTLEAAVSEKVDRIVKERNVTRDVAERIVGENQKGLIADTDILFPTGYPGGIPAGQMLDDSEKFNKITMPDPMDPNYDGGSRTKAQFFANLDKPGRDPIIHSQAHGGITYNFSRYVNKKTEATAAAPKETPQETVPWFSEALTNGSASRFLDAPPPALEWVFPGTLLARTTGMIVGSGGVGKTTMAILMAFVVATARDVLPGIFSPTTPGKALCVFGEDNEVVLHHRVHAMSETLFGDDPEAMRLLRENLNIITTNGKDLRFISLASRDLSISPFFTEVLTAVGKIKDLKLIILDPVSRFHGAEENDNFAGTFLVNLMEQISQETGAAVLFLHHVGKRSGMTPNGFDLAAAMNQDASRGASGLTNAVRWQLNLSGLPEKYCKEKLKIKDARPGQYLAVKVSKKNFGIPEDVHFLERHTGGLLLPFIPAIREIDTDLDEKLKSLVLDAVIRLEDKRFTVRNLIDGHQKAWKKEDSRITAIAVKETIATCIVNGELFERSGKNASGKKITYLSRYEETSQKTEPEIDFEPEIEPEKFKPENCKEPEKKGFTVYNHSKTKEIVEPEKVNREKEGLRFVSPRNCETVEPEIIPPYGGGMLPSGSHQEATSQYPEEDDNAEYFSCN